MFLFSSFFRMSTTFGSPLELHRPTAQSTTSKSTSFSLQPQLAVSNPTSPVATAADNSNISTTTAPDDSISFTLPHRVHGDYMTSSINESQRHQNPLWVRSHNLITPMRHQQLPNTSTATISPAVGNIFRGIIASL